MLTIEYDLEFFIAGVGSLEEYLFSKEIYWQLGIRSLVGSPPFPALTLGSLMLSRKRAIPSLLAGKARDQYNSTNREYEYLRDKWRSIWQKKAEREIRARLRLWQTFLEEYLSNSPANYDRYPYEVRRRVMITLLTDEIGFIPAPEQETLAELDKTLIVVLVPGDFIWEVELSQAFPKDKFPYLYGKLTE